MVDKRRLKEMPLTDFVAAVSVASSTASPLDLDFPEDSNGTSI